MGSLSISLQKLARTKDFSWESLTCAVPDAVRTNLWPSLVAGWSLWLPVGVLNYLVIPVRYQVLALNTISFFWNAYMVWRFTEAEPKRPHDASISSSADSHCREAPTT